MDKKKRFLILCERADKGSLALCGETVLLGDMLRGEVHALVLDREGCEQFFEAGASKVWVFEAARDCPDELSIANALIDWLRDFDPNYIFSEATVRIKTIMGMLAGMLGAGLTADCTAFEVTGEGEILEIRPTFGNSIDAYVRTEGKPQMATICPGKEPAPRKRIENGQIEILQLEIKPYVEQVDFKAFDPKSLLANAKVIFAGGAGIGSRENFALLEELAKKYGGGVGATRDAVMAGYVPYSCQIGQTGVSVSPDLYVAFAISGATQHIAGLGGAKKILAINSDPKAPIFEYADYKVVADWKEMAEYFIKQ